MRQGNSKQRMRGRGGNGGGGPGRKGPNPLSRTYESTGPDVKIRGTALHVAEKYVSLARDAHSSGDPVLAENYLQHAEHYYRIIAAAQAQLPQGMAIIRSDLQTDDEDDDGGEGYQETRFDPRPQQQDVRQVSEGRPERSFEPREPRAERAERPEPRVAVGEDGVMPVDAPQPFLDEQPGDRTREDRRPAGDRGERMRGRGFRNGPREGGAREGGPREPREGGAREGGPREGGRYEGRPPRERHPRGEPREPVRAADEVAPDAGLEQLPAFLMTPTPRPAPVVAPVAPVEPVAQDEAPAADAGEAAAPRRRARGGRGRGRRAEFEGGEGTGETPVTVEE